MRVCVTGGAGSIGANLVRHLLCQPFVLRSIEDPVASHVFGPVQPAAHAYAAAIPAFVDAALNDRPIPVFGDGGQTRDFTYVGSVANVVTEAIHRELVTDEPVNLAFGTNRSILDVVDEIGCVLNRGLEVEHLPPRTGEVRDSQADQTRLRQLFPEIEPVPFREGLRATIPWFQTGDVDHTSPSRGGRTEK